MSLSPAFPLGMFTGTKPVALHSPGCAMAGGGFWCPRSCRGRAQPFGLDQLHDWLGEYLLGLEILPASSAQTNKQRTVP